MSVRIIVGDVREKLGELPDASVHCAVTSPPYFGLRDYGVTGQIGLEPTPDAYVAELVLVFREVRRVLRDDGTLWLNLGDSYAGSWGAQSRGGPPSDRSTLRGNGHTGGGPKIKNMSALQIGAAQHRDGNTGSMSRFPGLKPKDLIGIPWRVAFALQADGWWLRQDIVWSKPNPMPESVTDRCTKAHEYLFLLSKSERYHYDADAIMEDVAPATVARLSQDVASQAGSTRVPGKTNGTMKAVGRSRGTPPRHAQYDSSDQSGLDDVGRGEGRNRRSVWTVATQPFREAHFATFPPALVEPCILAGCPKGGTVLDPFGGAGTTGLVADRLGRSAVLIELNPAYAEIAERRIRADAPLLAGTAA